MNLADLKTHWRDTPEYHKHIDELFIELVNADPSLKAHRDYVEQNIWGFGERSFWWMWKMICDELPKEPKMLEIGVFRGATLSLWRLLNPSAIITGITPLNTAGGVWDSEYEKDIQKIHDDFKIPLYNLLCGYSQDSPIVNLAKSNGDYDVVYIDGDHSEAGALADLNNYAPMVKIGGFLVIDDCCCDMHMEFGYFQGIQPVQDAFDKWDKTGFEFICNAVHLRVMRRVA